MKQFLIIALCLSCFHIDAQWVSYRFNPEQKICEDSGASYLGIENWEVFQTDNDQLSGNKTKICAEFSDLVNSIIVSEAIAGRPIFFQNIDPLDLVVASSNIYSLNTSLQAPEDLLCDCISECSQNICNEVTIIFNGEISGNICRDTATVISSDIGNFNSLDNINFESCFVTPSYEQTTIERLIITVFPEQISSNDFIRFSTFFFDDVEQADFYLEDATFMNHVVPDDFRLGISYVVRPTFFTELKEEFDFGHVKVLNPNQSDPNNNNFFYYDVTPEDSTQQKIINIINSSFSQLVFQRDAQLRGALVAIPDNDSLRHRINLVNDGANMCLPPFVDLIMGGEDEFRFRSGTIEFANDWSCMQFRENAKLIVERDAHLHYGNHGIGLISLRPGASIIIEDNASLYFDGHLIMPDNNESLITISLEKNQSLTFSSHASIRTFQPEAKLTIYMKGGDLDISQLKPEYHQYLDIIYPEQLGLHSTSIVLYPNPVSDILKIYVTEDQLGTTVIIYDHTEQAVIKDIVLSERVSNIDVSGLAKGVYYVQHKKGNIQKIVVL